MSTDGRARGGRQFPVGRRRYVQVPVVDAGCGCRPRRPRLLHLPSFSFLSRPCQQLGVNIKQQYQAAAAAMGEQYSCASTSAASFSSSSAATRSSTTGYSSAYSSSDYHYYPTTITKQQQPLPSPPLITKQAASPAGKRQQQKGGRKKKKRQHEKQAAAGGLPVEDGVGVAVEKESSDPRADFRDSMVQMVVEMGLCDWDGLRGMLRRLLALNAPRHHAAILAAFAEVCAQLAAPPAALQPQPAYHYHCHAYDGYDYDYHY